MSKLIMTWWVNKEDEVIRHTGHPDDLPYLYLDMREDGFVRATKEEAAKARRRLRRRGKRE